MPAALPPSCHATMPAGQPFTAWCQMLSHHRADLHIHTTHSDGAYSPVQVIDLARRCGLAAVAVTDHDTTAGVGPACKAALGTGVEVVPGVEITAEHRGREIHLLAYFVDPDHPPLRTALDAVCRDRATRFGAMLERLRQIGVSIQEEGALTVAPQALGRRHLAEMLVRQGQVSTVREAFTRYLGERGGIAVPKQRLPAARALELVRQAGGVAAWAHPAYDQTLENLTELRDLGLGAVEAEYPDTRRSRARQLRDWASALGLAISGGSDCHGPGKRSVGSCTITTGELEQLRRMVAR